MKAKELINKIFDLTDVEEQGIDINCSLARTHDDLITEIRDLCDEWITAHE